jgi:hypothetical protein
MFLAQGGAAWLLGRIADKLVDDVSPEIQQTLLKETPRPADLQHAYALARQHQIDDEFRQALLELEHKHGIEVVLVSQSEDFN